MTDEYPQRSFVLPPDATEIVLVRHGASAPAVPGRSFPLIEGQSDPPLAPEGEAQARAVCARLAEEALAGLFVTSLQRTVQTAAPLAEVTGLQPVAIPELREVFLGDLEGGEYRIRAARHDPVILEVFAQERWDAIPNAESSEAFGGRLRAGIEAIVRAVGPGVVAAAIVHGGVIGELCRQASGSRPFAFVHADNGSLSRLVVFGDGRWLLRSFNDTAHLNGAVSRAAR